MHAAICANAVFGTHVNAQEFRAVVVSLVECRAAKSPALSGSLILARMARWQDQVLLARRERRLRPSRCSTVAAMSGWFLRHSSRSRIAGSTPPRRVLRLARLAWRFAGSCICSPARGSDRRRCWSGLLARKLMLRPAAAAASSKDMRRRFMACTTPLRTGCRRRYRRRRVVRNTSAFGSGPPISLQIH